MIRPRGFGSGPAGKSEEEIEREAAAELRKALAGTGPRPDFSGRAASVGREPPEPARSDPAASGWPTGLSADDERQVITDFAVQQLTERPFGTIRPEDTVPGALPAVSPEDMRNRALAEILERQRRMARERPVPPPPANRELPASGQRTSGVTISPRLTVAPTLTGRGPALPAHLLAPSPAPAPTARADSPTMPSLPEGPLARSEAATGPADGVWTRPVKPKREFRAVPVSDLTGAAAPSPMAASGLAGAGNRRDVSSPAPGPAVPHSAQPSVRTRPVQRRAGARTAQPAAMEADGRWRALAELADLLAEEVYPGDALPRVCRWLAATVDSTVAVVLVTGDTIDDVVAWPDDEPVALDLDALVGGPVDGQSSVSTAVNRGRALQGDSDDPMIMPDGAAARDVGAWVVAPIADRGVAFGALLVARAGSEALPERIPPLAEEIARRIARALYNCEEAASTVAAGDGLPAPLRDRLGALAVVLDAIQGLPAPKLPPGLDRDYQQVARQAVALQSQLELLLTAQGDDGR